MLGTGPSAGLASSSSNNEARSLGTFNKEELLSRVASLQDVLEGRNTSPLDLAKVQKHIELLRLQVQQLQSNHKEETPCRFQIFNRIEKRSEMGKHSRSKRPKNRRSERPNDRRSERRRDFHADRRRDSDVDWRRDSDADRRSERRRDFYADRHRDYVDRHRDLFYADYDNDPNLAGDTNKTTLPAAYFDEPQWIFGQNDEPQLHCNLPVHNMPLYLEKNKDISFVVYRNFDQALDRDTTSPTATRIRRGTGLLHSQPTKETIQPISQLLIEAIEKTLRSREEYFDILQHFRSSTELEAPYLFIYHSRKDLDAIQERLSPAAFQEMSLLLDYIKSEYGNKYGAADALLARGKISSEYVPFLFKPGDILIKREDGRYHEGFMATNWPCIMSSVAASSSLENVDFYDPEHSSLHVTQDGMRRVRQEEIRFQHWSVEAWQWDFDGNFQRHTIRHEFSIEVDEADKWDTTASPSVWQQHARERPKPKEVSIIDLAVFPLKCAAPELVETLRKRGSTFWKCRTPQLVSYLQDDKYSAQNMVEERFMVDLPTYYELHSEKGDQGFVDEIGAEALAKNNPPDENFAFLVPRETLGYNLRLKRWIDLNVDRISEVEWNVEAFQSLVLERKAKELIEALVSKQIAAEKATDLIVGKGNGLLLLLHGGPGTGKTLTAESVAEIARKPLYRVTCGDVGTKAEDVEMYLESVLHLGKIWGCVVLLDEADVFLEQRSLADLQRNALVSVFLRVLEYYEGILILTSNRVGTFDEAFKSRIQLALQYPSLGNYQRLRIWENFFKRLESFDDNTIDFADLRDHLEDLAKEEMNGRQIRNAITTARQYAEWKGKIMTYEHLKDVIEVAGRFDKYMDKLHEGFTGDQLAEDEGLRLA
ncbi:hypothetical protein LTR10_022235 [Elasticomyces elasticus]|uniref:AAA+ ATPase domain-containing protein n=1 Tax=Exophiala sideris TaxID=1016849 RepID=A0ABR0JII2_9EURO|nr:hypothetical protein LTR10_022235 [Elasticomyces elasticus]KAK5034413.1 hypothetical protein LTS07_003334 [Exophiala sideris]KAK5042710.1 hypothetical protein LTR13_001558 [Exophiala sideris]KAK5065793.1 hypothetical protein LTR69_003343 [Exophiala sideris]KAK5185746.1 hypothetical protein LTR44_001795 [Eurotiomycetes sp. CCFEE 6388]